MELRLLGFISECYTRLFAGMLRIIICTVLTTAIKAPQKLGKLPLSQCFRVLKWFYRYCVPGKHKEDFDRAIKTHYAELFIKNPHAIYRLCLMMNPLELRKMKVSFAINWQLKTCCIGSGI